MMTVVPVVTAVMPHAGVRVLPGGGEDRASADDERQDECEYDSEFLHSLFTLSFNGSVDAEFQPAKCRRRFRARRFAPTLTRTRGRNARANECRAEFFDFRVFSRGRAAPRACSVVAFVSGASKPPQAGLRDAGLKTGGADGLFEKPRRGFGLV